MRRVSMATRDELIGRYRGATVRWGGSRGARILDEFVAVTGYHRKHAMRVLRVRAHGLAPGIAARPACLRRGGSGSDDPSYGKPPIGSAANG